LILAQSALDAGQAAWNALPHTNLAQDLAAVATQMTTAGVLLNAGVSVNGISGSLSDGTPFLLAYDNRDSESSSTTQQASPVIPAIAPTVKMMPNSAVAARPVVILNGPLGASTTHEILFLVNTEDTRAFDPRIQLAFANAFYQAGFPASMYEADTLAVSLENIIALGTTHPIDYINVVTHGAVGCNADQSVCNYFWLSSTGPSDTDITTYSGDLLAKRIMLGAILQAHPGQVSQNILRYWFAPDFLLAHTTFNPGAIFINSSCYGQASTMTTSVGSILTSAGINLYSGWTGQAFDFDADQSDAYMLDRLLGEQSPAANTLGALTFEHSTLGPMITQKTPPQRPFPITDVMAAMGTIQRLASPDPRSKPAALNQSTVDDALLVVTTLNGGEPSDPSLFWGLPSIESMQVTESAAGGTLTIFGHFPATPGKAQLTDASGTYPLTPISWTRQRITAALPPGGNGASGAVQVLDVDGVPSNSVPLTEWKGQLTVTVNNVLTNMNGVDGSGSGTIVTTTSLDFRADIHPVVTTVDATPQPQNFVFLGVMGDSRTSVTSVNVNFTSSNGMKSAQFGLAQPVTTLTPVYTTPVLSGTFIIAPYVGEDEPTSCNEGVPGPQSSGPTNVFCPFGGIYADNALTCTDSDGSLCQEPTLLYTGYYGYPPSVAPGGDATGYDGLLKFTLDPQTHAITFTSNPATLTIDYLFSEDDHLTINLAATIQPPSNAPTTATPATTSPGSNTSSLSE
jgi:hypothetical protein